MSAELAMDGRFGAGHCRPCEDGAKKRCAAGGNEAITAGGLSILIDVRAGSGGLETVSGFRASIDGLHLVGYGSSEQASAIATQASDGRGGSLLAFSDGTRVDLMGIAAANQTMFA